MVVDGGRCRGRGSSSGRCGGGGGRGGRIRSALVGLWWQMGVVLVVVSRIVVVRVSWAHALALVAASRGVVVLVVCRSLALVPLPCAPVVVGRREVVLANGVPCPPCKLEPVVGDIRRARVVGACCRSGRVEKGDQSAHRRHVVCTERWRCWDALGFPRCASGGWLLLGSLNAAPRRRWQRSTLRSATRPQSLDIRPNDSLHHQLPL